MKNLFTMLEAELKAGHDTMMVTVVAGSGSTPRGAGARMLVGAGGQLAGTIGGGAVEHRAEQLAREALATGKSYTKAFTLRRNEVEDLGMICGGDVKVFIQYIAATPAAAGFAGRVADALGGGASAWLLYDITDETAWQMGLYITGRGLVVMEAQKPEGAQPTGGLEALEPGKLPGLLSSTPRQTEAAGRLFYSEPIVHPGRVVVFGGGHVSQELVPVLAHVGFRCVVFEDRPEFCAEGLFPDATERICGDFEAIAASLVLTPDDYVVIMTRGHASDFVVQNQVLRAPLAYCGVIGSRKKIAAVSAKLQAEGIPQSAIDAVHTPIGLDIKAQTPAEIAISIAGEMILVRAQLAEAAAQK